MQNVFENAAWIMADTDAPTAEHRFYTYSAPFELTELRESAEGWKIETK